MYDFNITWFLQALYLIPRQEFRLLFANMKVFRKISLNIPVIVPIYELKNEVV